ncbi:radical SAM protein [Lederbergia ruris]|uniref:radical SAM protein n=1 Tax=Lederbergia ruris TaxID=217495 RepID=UPI0039A24307
MTNKTIKDNDFEFDLFEMNDDYFLFDPGTITAFQICKEIYDNILNAKTKEEHLKILDELYSQGFFRASSPPGSGQWSQDQAGITLMNTNLCNLRCPYCVMDHVRRKDQVSYMSWETAKKAVDYLFDDFGKEASSLGISYSLTGEPLLNFPLMEDVAKYVRERERDDGRPCQIYFSTNGTLINKRVIDFIKKYKVLVNISIDGTIEKHDSLRYYSNGKGSFDQGLKGSKKLLEESGIFVSCSPTLTAENVNIREIFETIWDIGFRTIAMKPVRGEREEVYTFDKDSIKALQSNYLDFVNWLLTLDDKELYPRLLSIVPPSNDYFGRIVGKIFLQTRDTFRCQAGKTDIAIDADGQVYSCFSVTGISDMKLGSISCDSTQLNNAGFWSLSVDERTPCRDCTARYTCGGGCACTAYQANRNSFTPDPIDCELQIFLTRLAVYFVSKLQRNRPELTENLLKHMWNNLQQQMVGV